MGIYKEITEPMSSTSLDVAHPKTNLFHLMKFCHSVTAGFKTAELGVTQQETIKLGTQVLDVSGTHVFNARLLPHRISSTSHHPSAN
jgi:hypothetical protein